MYYDTFVAGTDIFVFLLCVVLVLVVVIYFFAPSKSRRYRKMMADLFVVGRIKQLAKEKGIVLAKEFEEFKKWLKGLKLEEYSLDATIEEELKEDISKIKEEIKDGLP